MIKENKFKSKLQLAEALATDVADQLDIELQATGNAILAVSGGSTPKQFFAALSQIKIDWAGVTVTLVDERWLDEESNRSNAKLVRQNLLQNHAKEAAFLSLYVDADLDEGIAKKCEEFAQLEMDITVAILGMGLDGHTASFFPNGNRLIDALDLENASPLIGMLAPSADEPRITFTLNALLKAKQLYLHIEGDDKWAVLQKAQANGPSAEMPIRAVLNQEVADVNIFWCP